MSNDAVLGEAVHAHLIQVGVETPMKAYTEYSTMNEAGKKVELAHHVKKIMQILELDLGDDSLEETPNRVAKMYYNELFSGLRYENFPKCTVIDNKMASELVVVKNIDISSMCEHHLITISGFASVAYIPSGKVLGLSKINRIVGFFARRPQVQERLTNQIWHALSYILDTEDIAVYIDATHYCVKARGIRDANSSTVTNKLGGKFMASAELRSEFMSIARGN